MRPVVSGLPFTKMSGSGNDFVVVARQDAPDEPEMATWVQRLCRRGLSVGADGVLILGPSRDADVHLAHYNADGGRSSLCGNGTRCAARWARLERGGGAEPLVLETGAGPVEASFPAPDTVSIRLPFRAARPGQRRIEIAPGQEIEGHFVEVGIPHFLVPVDDVESAAVVETGSLLRNHPSFAPQGTNVSFVSRCGSEGSLELRTFERGVEAETLACGTACVAAAILAVGQGWSRAPVICHTRSGIDLTVELEADQDLYRDLRLAGDARVVYHGRLGAQALEWGK